MKPVLLALLLALPPQVRTTPGDTLRIMPLGDSITELDWQGGYRSYLYAGLIGAGLSFDYVGTKVNNHDDNSIGFAFPEPFWNHEGYNSATITGSSGSTWIWNQKLEAKLAANPPDVLLLMLGTNDLNSSCCTVADIRDQMSAFLDQVWVFDQEIIVVLGGPPPVRPSTLNGRIAAFVALLPALVEEKTLQGRSIILADHNAVLNTGADLTGDGIHPSPAGYRKMAQVWYDAVWSLIAPPARPLLATPIDNGTVPAGQLDAVRFAWHPARDPDPADTLTYALHITGPGVDHVVGGLRDTSVAPDLSGILLPGVAYRWSVSVNDGLSNIASADTFGFLVDPASAVGSDQGQAPAEFALWQNYPNPFNPVTTIHYSLPARERVLLRIYNPIGQAVATLVDAELGPGSRSARWDAAGYPGGVYYYSISAGPFRETKAMVLLR